MAVGPLQTGTVLGTSLTGADQSVALERAREAGARVVRVAIPWAAVAPERPANGRDPADPAYDWTSADQRIRAVRSYGLEPLVSIEGAPEWAQDRSKPLPWQPADPRYRGSVRPNAAAFGAFAYAAARRYGGGYGGLPRVRLWRAWNEPNLSLYLLPQYQGTRAVSVPIYRNLLNAFADGVHAVHRDNIVVGGGPSPLATRTKIAQAIAPLRFMRELLCLSKGAHPHPTCASRAKFDVWAVQPYTSGGPTHRAQHADDVSLGNLPQVKSVLDAGVRTGKIVSRQKVQLWVTEFSWDSRPPDLNRYVVPLKLEARWVSEALYHAWRSGVSLFTWFTLRDNPYPGNYYQGGLYFRGDSPTRDFPKPALTAFHFPFVAYRSGARTAVWGRTPAGTAATVAIEASRGGSWKRLATLRANAAGIFQSSVRTPPARSLAAAPAPPQTAARYRKLVRQDGATSYWTLDDSGRAARDTVGTKNGTYRGGVKLGVPGALGSLDRAISLDGRNDRVSLGQISSPGTVELWLKSDATNQAAAFSNRNATSRFTFLGLSGAVRARALDSAGLSGESWITDGRWHHLVYTYDGATGRLYVDGALADSSAYTRFAGGARAYLGFDATLRTHLRGSIDEVALYRQPLTAAQVRAHFLASGRPAGYGAQVPIMSAGQTYLRARLVTGSGTSLPFSLTPVPDRYVNPFGT